MKKTYLILLFCLTGLIINAQNVNIPDINFKNYLLSNVNINKNGDGEIQVTEAMTFSGILDVSVRNISDLTGIEAFVAINRLRCAGNKLGGLNLSTITALTYLDCSYNQIWSLNLSKNTALLTIDCKENQLSILDLSKNTALTFLDCSSNQLTSLNISACKLLSYLSCGYNLLSNLNVSQNTALVDLYCRSNKLPSLDLSSNKVLSILDIASNHLTSLDVSNNTALKYLECRCNPLTSLNLSYNKAFESLYCDNTDLTSLDFSSNPALATLSCSRCKLKGLNLKNGNNTKISLFYAYFNSKLTCIQVDDSAWSTANWKLKDSTAVFRENCSFTGFDEKMGNNQLTVFPNPAHTFISIPQKEDFEKRDILIFNSSGKVVISLNDFIGELVEISQLPNGLYFLKLCEENYCKGRCFLVEH